MPTSRIFPLKPKDTSTVSKDLIQRKRKAYQDFPTLLCLGGGVESVPMLEILGREHKLVVMDWNEKSAGALWVEANKKNGHQFFYGNTYSPSNAYKTFLANSAHLSSKNKGVSIDGVLCVATDCPDTQAVIADRLGVPSIGGEAAKAGRDKWVQVQALASAGLPVPETKHLDVKATWEDLEGFDIIKPVASRGARGVQRLIKDDYKKQIFIALNEGMAGYKRFVVQKYIEGLQFSTESIVYNEQIVFTCFALRNYEYLDRFHPNIIENGCDAPFHVSADQLRNYNDLILKSADALNWGNWTIKGDLVLRPDGQWVIIELAPRLSGGLLSSNIIPESYGYEYVSAFAEICKGNAPYEYTPPNNFRYCSQRYLFPEKDWTGKVITSLPDNSNNGVRYYKSVGDKIEPVTSHANRLGQVIVTANSSLRARERAESVARETENQITAA